MGMYTVFVLGCYLRHDTPREITETLAYMIDGDLFAKPKELPNHPFFETERWHFMLQSESAYFPGISKSDLMREHYEGAPWNLTIRCDLKNYDNEIEKFLNWIEPHIQSEGFLGYFQYEEDDDPTLIYIIDGAIELVEIYSAYQQLVDKRRKNL